jgi:hypothetical protein
MCGREFCARFSIVSSPAVLDSLGKHNIDMCFVVNEDGVEPL